jgi:endonuclease/exonuclease/phosphatase family metal-dependent hydrolase
MPDLQLGSQEISGTYCVAANRLGECYVFQFMRILAVAVLALAACAHAAPKDTSLETTFPKTAGAQPLPRDFRVMTFNLHGETGAHIVNAITKDPALRTADLLVLEEVHGHHGCSTACEVARALGMHAVYEPEFADRDGSDGVAIVSRAPIDSAQIIPLPYINVHWNDEERRAAVAATVRVDGQPITVYAVHLTNRLTVGQRRRQMMPVLEHAARQKTPVIIAGDFNTSPFTWLAHTIPIPTGTQDDRFEELMRAHGFQTPVVASGSTHRYFWMKLDAIYTRGFTTRAFATTNALKVSDHRALWAQVTAIR